jgi:hypothetical protein
MSRTDDLWDAVQKAVGDRPLYLLAGAGDLVSEKLRELPEALSSWQEENRDFPLRAAGALVGSAFRANLKAGELYDELTRRGHDVVAKMRGDDPVAEEDEPFVREPFMPEPVRPVAAPPRISAASNAAGPAKKSAAKKTAANKTAAKTSATAKATVTRAAAKKTATVKRTTAVKKATAVKKTAVKKTAAKKTAAKKTGAS